MSYRSSEQKFTYAAHKGSYLSIICSFIFITLSEGLLEIASDVRFSGANRTGYAAPPRRLAARQDISDEVAALTLKIDEKERMMHPMRNFYHSL